MGWRMSCDVGKATEGLEKELWRRWSDGKVGEWAELHLRYSSFSNPSVALPTSQFILQPFRCFTYDTAHSPTLVSLLLRHRLFTWRAAQPFRHFTYVTAHSPTLVSLLLRHRRFTWRAAHWKYILFLNRLSVKAETDKMFLRNLQIKISYYYSSEEPRRLKRLMADGSVGVLVVSKALALNLNSFS